MQLTVNDVVTRATFLLNDSGNATVGVAANTRWSVAEMIDWVSDAQRQIVLMKPSASNTVTTLSLVAGTRQSLPSDGWLLLCAIRNTSGRVIREADRKTLDAQNVNWHVDPAQSTVWNYMYDEQDQYAFYVYPPNDGTGSIVINYSAQPVALANLTDNLLLDSIYLTPMVDYVCFRALTKDAEFAGGASLAANFYQSFHDAIGERVQSEKQDSPDASPPPLPPLPRPQ